MGALGRAYIEVHADTAPFKRELGPKLRKIVKDIKPDVDRAGQAIGKNLVESTTEQVGKDGEKIGRKVKKVVEEYVGSHRVKVEVDVDIDRNRFRRFLAGVTTMTGNALSRIGLDTGGASGGLFGTIASGATSALKQVGLLTTAMSSEFLVVLAPIVFLLGSLLVGALVSTAAALADLIGLVGLAPGGFFILAAAVAPLVIALNGFGEAIGAILDGDPERVAAALDKLAPSARNVAQEFQATLPFLRKIKEGVQESFFTRIQGGWMEFIQTNGPTISLGLQNIAYALGNLVRGLFDVADSPGSTAFFNNLLGTTRRIIDILSGPLSRLLAAVFGVSNAALPTLEKLAAGFGGWIDRFAAFIEKSIQDGSFQQFLDDALATAGDLKDMAKELWGLFKAIFTETSDGGRTFLQDVTDAIRRLKEFFESEEGKDSLRALVDLAEQLGRALKIAADAAGPVLAVLTYGGSFGTGSFNNGNLLSGRKGSHPAQKGGGGPTFTQKAAGYFKGYAHGGIFDRPTVGLIGEAGTEVLLPLNNPKRAASLAQQSGLMDVIGGGGTNVYVYIGNEPIDQRAMKVVTQSNYTTGRALARGPREAI